MGVIFIFESFFGVVWVEGKNLWSLSIRQRGEIEYFLQIVQLKDFFVEQVWQVESQSSVIIFVRRSSSQRQKGEVVLFRDIIFVWGLSFYQFFINFVWKCFLFKEQRLIQGITVLQLEVQNGNSVWIILVVLGICRGRRLLCGYSRIEW